MVSNQGSRKLPTEAELEAEAEREREQSRREAEMIMRREAEERRMLEDRVLQMFDDTPKSGSPRQRAQTMPAQSSPTPSQKEKDGWFAAVKSRLTPTKEPKDPLTPAQQIIQDTKAKAKEKEKKKEKGKGKEKMEEPREWPATPSRKYSDPAFLNLAASNVPEPVTPPRPIGQDAAYMTPSPGRSIDSSKDGPPLYAQFSNQGVLDVPDTLLTIARRFEKLEKWTVTHVRALEVRMADVERWLADKEKAQPEEKSVSEKSSFHSEEDDEADNNVAEIREELIELQGRVGELGREMAKLMTAPLNLTQVSAKNTVVSQQQQQGVPPTPSSIAPRTLPTLPPVMTPRQITPTPQRTSDAPSPPSASTQRSSSMLSSGSGRTRLPYPTGDYTSPPGSVPIKQEILSPTNSPPSSITDATRKRPLSVSGLPSASSSFFNPSSESSTSGLPQRQEVPVRALSPKSPSSSTGSPRQTNISPTPRKRYTVALGQPITGHSALESDEEDLRRSTSTSDGFETSSMSDEGHEISHSRESTIGKSVAQLATPPNMPNDTFKRGTATPSPNPNRVRAQSSYGPPRGFDLSSLGHGMPSSSPAPITPLRLRVRSKSIDRVGLGLGIDSSGKFVDPLLLRRQEKDTGQPKTPRTPMYERGKKVPVNELVAYFDKDKQR